ncbi:hypothetical protein FJM67_04990 [Maribrevibacterium harenarium]|uniref:Uncharacterized protein n=1 Tax=Maribrevibacterium harenarium TaxID=2589817 RepID=A0A501X070_9GAMM|nr:hypothetical protein [Maribrevibacterium harenarium]TPE54304.1 hypothetical protein FJM67_04990 [Maribrevibacterium harenarium]
MHRLIHKLERRVGLFWAYLLLFMITWMLMAVVWSFLEVNSTVKQYRKQTQGWQQHWQDGLVQELQGYQQSPWHIDAMESWFKQQASPLLVGIGRIGGAGKPLLSVTTHDSYPNLNVFTSSRGGQQRTVTEIYPHTGMGTLFFGADFNQLKTQPMQTANGALSDHRYSILYTEERYFLLVTAPMGGIYQRLYLYNLDDLFSQFIQSTFAQRAQYILRESRFAEQVLLDKLTHNLSLTEHSFDFSGMDIPVRYQVRVPVLIKHLDWIGVFWRATMTSLMLYLFLFFYNRMEVRKLRPQG